MRTDEEIVQQTNELARDFYGLTGNRVSPGYRFDRAAHPLEQLCWKMACRAQELLTETNPEDALSAVD
jgi:hypothetical protein